MRYPIFRSIRTNLILLVLISVLPALGAIIYTGLDNNRRTIKEAENNTLRVLADLAYDYELTVQQAHLFLSMLARLPDIQNQNAAACNKILGELIKQNPLYVKLFVATADGTVYASNEPFSPHTIKHRKYYQDIIKTRAFSVGEYEAGVTVQRPVIHFAYPVIDTKQRLRGVVALALDLNRYGEIFIKKEFPEDSAFAIYDHNHIYLYRYPDPEQYVGKKDRPDMIKRMVTGPDEETITAIGVEGIPRLGAYKKLYVQGSSIPYHFMRIGISAEKALANARKTFLFNIVLLCSALFAALILALVFGDIFIARRLNRLVIASNRLGGGDLTARTGLRQDEGEMGRLAHAFDEMADALERKEAQRKRIEKALQESEERFRLLSESARDTIWTMDMNLQYTYMNPYIKHALDYTPEEYVAIPLNKTLTPSSLELCMQVLSEELEIEKREDKDPLRSRTIEVEHIHRNGSIVWAEIKMTFIRNAAGQATGILGYTRDITERVRTVNALQESEGKYRLIAENMADVISVLDMNLRFTYISPSIMRLRGFTVEEAMKETLDQVLTPESLTIVLSAFEEEMKLEASETADPDRIRTMELEEYRKDGSIICVESSLSYLRDKDNKPVGILAVTRDITDRKRVEASLKQSEERMRLFFERQLVGMAITSPEKGWLQVNKKLSEMLGYLPEELSLLTWAEMTHPDDLAADVAQFTRLLSGEIDHYFLEKRFIRKDRVVINTNLSVGCVRRQDGSVDYVLALLEDITERRRAEDALRESEEKYRRIFETTLEGIYQTTPQGRYLRVNPAFAFMLGYASPEDLIGSITDIGTQVYVNPDRRSEFRRHLSEHSRVENFEAQLYRKDGTTIWGLINGVTVRNENGDILYFTGGMMDVTERKGSEIKLRTAYEQLRATDEQMRAQYDSLIESERSLRESEDKYRRLTETAHDVIVSVDLNFKITYVNQATIDLAGGMNPVGMSLLRFTPSHMHELQEAMMQKRREGFSDVMSFEWEMNLPTGKIAAFDIRATLLTKDEKPSGVLFVARDITERKRTEEKLRRLSIAVEQAAEDIIITDPEGVIQYVNPAFEKITGYSRVEVIGKTPRILKSGVHDAAFYEHLWKMIRSGEIWTGRITNLRKDGILIEEDATICPLLTSAGTLTGYVALKRDVTEAVQLEAQFRQSQKMEAVGQLAGGVAHDFNNILQAILGYTDIVLFSLGPDDKNRAKLMEVYKAGQRAAALTQQLLAFSRRQVLQLAPLDLNQVIEDLMKMLRHLIGENIELHITPCRELLTVNADRSQIEQVVMNLCLNARDAMPEGGRLSIETGNVLFDASYCAQHEWAKPGWHVFLSITDSGRGMDEETKGRIFEPFFTTKEPDRGTGLGLSTVYGIVRQHNGMIEVYTEPGKGSRFNIYLPAVEWAETIIIPESNESIPGGHETILLAEDNEQVRHLATGILEKSGYKVLTAVDGEEALLVYQDHGGEIDLLLLDVVMPKKSGRNVYDEIRSVCSDVRCLFISGYSVNAVHTNFILDQGLHLIQKPFKNNDLLRAVRQTLDRS